MGTAAALAAVVAQCEGFLFTASAVKAVQEAATAP
jgi:hypothetical protein